MTILGLICMRSEQHNPLLLQKYDGSASQNVELNAIRLFGAIRQGTGVAGSMDAMFPPGADSLPLLELGDRCELIATVARIADITTSMVPVCSSKPYGIESEACYRLRFTTPEDAHLRPTWANSRQHKAILSHLQPT